MVENSCTEPCWFLDSDHAGGGQSANFYDFQTDRWTATDRADYARRLVDRRRARFRPRSLAHGRYWRPVHRSAPSVLTVANRLRVAPRHTLGINRIWADGVRC